MTLTMRGFLSVFILVLSLNGTALAQDMTAGPEMQQCTTDADCVLVDARCGVACSFLPVNKQSQEQFETRKTQMCGEQKDAMTQCRTVPPLNATCINQRCTIAVAYQENAEPADYSNKPVPKWKEADAPRDEPSLNAPVASKAPAASGDFDDRHGFTAYNLPEGSVMTKSLGTIDPAQR